MIGARSGGVRRASLRVRLRALRQRLAARPDTEHEMTMNRIVIVCAALAYLYAAHWLGFAEATLALDYGKVLCSAYLAASCLLFVHILWRPGVSHGRRLVALILDMGTLSFGMHLADSAFSLGYPIYLWIIFGNGFRFGVRYLATAALAALAGFCAVIWTTPMWWRDLDLSIGLMLGLIILPAYVAALIRKLSEAKQQAEAANKAKSLFLASVSHELRTPLNAIITLSDLLKAGGLEREQRDMAGTIGDSGRSLLKLIDDILDYSRIEAGKQPMRVREFHLVDVLTQTRRVLGVQAARKSLGLKVMIGPDVPSLLHGARQDLEQILTNLVGNAIKFTASGGVSVSVGLVRDEAVATEEGGSGVTMLRFKVTDTGIGMTEEALGRIFDSFTQADDSIIDRFGGTGLGLSIVKQLVERNGGAISVASTPGEGSTFTFTLAFEEARGGGVFDLARCRAIVVTNDPVLPILVGQFGASTQRVATAAGLSAALGEWDDASGDPVVLVDLDSLNAGALGNVTAILSERAHPAVVGFLSKRDDAWPEASALPLAMAVPSPVSVDDWQKLMQAASRADEADEGAVRLPLRPLSILVAEDNRTNQAVVRKLLEKDGHRIVVVENGELAVEALEKGSYDLVLMDINMPVMNGFEATKLHRFAALGRPYTPIYALTADVTDETRERAVQAGMDGCLHKPIDLNELENVFARIAGAERDETMRPATPSVAVAEAEFDVEQVALIDEAALVNLENLGGIDFVSELSTQFAQDARRHFEALTTAVADCDVQGFRETAHSLRSSAANVGARRLFAMCLDWRAATDRQLALDGEAWLAQLGSVMDQTDEAIASLLADRARAAKRA